MSGDRVRRIKGSPKNWSLDMGGEPHDVDLEDEGDDQEEVEFVPPTIRQGERKAVYFSRRDFQRHGYSDGSVGRRAIASGKRVAPERHTILVVGVEWKG